MTSHLPRWQKETHEKKNRKIFFFFRLLFLIVFSLGFLLVVFQAYRLWQRKAWDGSSRVTIVFKSEEVILVSLEPQTSSLMILKIPANLWLEVPHGYGKYQVGMVSKLSSLEKRPGLLVETIEENLAIPVDGWLETANFFQGDEKANLLRELQAALTGKEKTNLGFWDLLRFWWKVKQVKEGDTTNFNLESWGVLSPLNLPDQTVVLTLDQIFFDKEAQKYFAETSLKQESLSFEVLNGTKHPGLAEKTARLLTNMGVQVVSVGNASENTEKCLLKSLAENKEKQVLKKISRLFDCQWQGVGEEGRAEVSLILGEAYWQKLNLK